MLGLNLNDLYFSIFEIYLLFVVIILLIFCVFITNTANTLNKKYYVINNSLLNLLVFSLVFMFLLNYNNLHIYYLLFNNYYVNNEFVFYFINIVLLLSILFLFLFKQYLIDKPLFDYEFLIVLFLTFYSMFLILHANDFLLLYLAIELQSLCFYVLVSSKQVSSFSTEAGLKYFILGSFSSGLLLFGISLIYGFSGLLNFEELSIFSYSLSFNTLADLTYISFIKNGFILGILFVTIALLFKLGVVPFHMWVPDVYEGAPTIITAFLSLIPKLVLIFVFIKLYYGVFFYFFSYWNYVFTFVALLSVILGSIAALYQIKIKRLLTYSMITNSGFFIFGLSLGSLEGIQVILLYILIYLFIMFGIFAVILTLKEKSNSILIKKIALLINLYNINPILALTLSIFLFSIAGIPPLVGFYGKFYLFYIALGNSLYIIALLFIIFSIVSIFYYVRLIKLMFFNKNKLWFYFESPQQYIVLLLSVLLFFNILFFIQPNLIFKLAYNLSILFYL